MQYSIYNSREEGKNHTDTEIIDLSTYTIKELTNAVSTRVLMKIILILIS